LQTGVKKKTMIKQDQRTDREKFSALRNPLNRKIILPIIALLSMIILIILFISMHYGNIHSYDITPENSSTRYTIRSHNDLSGVRIISEDIEKHGDKHIYITESNTNNDIDNNDNNKNSNKGLYSKNNNNSGKINNNTADIIIDIQKNKIAYASFSDVNLSSDFELGIDVDVAEIKIESYITARSYAIDPSGIDFSNATFVINATGRQLFKCAEYDFSNQECLGSWKKIMDITPGKEYDLLITRSDPAFIETNESQFDLGSYNKTFYNESSGSVQLNRSFNNGTYTSQVFDAGGLARWTNISWNEGAPYGNELPDNKQVETVQSGANMTGNILLLHLNDGSSATIFNDTSGSKNNGSCAGADCPTWNSSGRFGGAYSFDGGDRIGTPVTTALTDFTVEVWFKDNADNVQYERLADKSYTACFWLGRNSNKANSWGGGVRETSGSYGIFVTLKDGEWHQIVSIRNGTTHYIYGDGGKVVASNTVTSTACDATTLAIGAWGAIGSTQQRFTGLIDEVSFYNRSLSAQEVLDHYKRGVARLNLTVRNCDDDQCAGDSWNRTYENSSLNNIAMNNSKYFQYKAEFFTYDTNISPQLFNTSIGYDILDNSAPIIYLERPDNLANESSDKTPEFRFNATDETASSLDCTLWMNFSGTGISENMAENSSVHNSTSTIMTPIISLSNGIYEWWIECTDGFNVNTSQKRIININVPDMDPPSITLESPENNTTNTIDNTPEFRFTPIDDIAETLNCQLLLNISGTVGVYGQNISIMNGSIGSITANSELPNQNITWWINCSDGANTNNSEKRNIQIKVDTAEPLVSLMSPLDMSSNIDLTEVNFNCSATDDIMLSNISLYSDYNGIWQVIETKNISGISDSKIFTKSIYNDGEFFNNYFRWNCLAFDNTSKSGWADSNKTFSNWNLGLHSNTIYNQSLHAIVLDNYSLDGLYQSEIFDAGEVVGWKNMSWESDALNSNSEIDYFSNSESKSYYVQNTYSVRHWYNTSGIISDFSQLKVQAALDCDGVCSGTTYVRIGNSTNWDDYAFVEASTIRTDSTTSDYSYYNMTYDISMNEYGSYFFVQLLIYTGTGTVSFLMDESGPEGPDPEYRSASNGDGSQTGWTNDNGDYAIKITTIQNNNINISVRSCNDPNCAGEQWSNPLSNSTISVLSVPSNRYFQYKAYLDSGSDYTSPKLYNVSIKYGGADNIKPTITLISPINGQGDNGYITNFTYIVSDDSSIESCRLLINDIISDTDDVVINGSNSSFSIYNMPEGRYRWYINCTDVSGNENSSQIRDLTIISAFNYGGRTTDFSNVDIENITNLIIEQPAQGLINFTETINLSSGADINAHVQISSNLISIDSEMLPELDTNAILTLYNLEFANPIILKDLAACQDCEILRYNGNLTFSVQGFSSYSASENSQLEIWDDTEFTWKRPGQLINFFANYSNTTNSEPITGASCNITFQDEETGLMSYNSSSKLFEYSKSFSSAGIFYYEILCNGSAAGFTTLNTSDYSSVNNIDGPQAGNITLLGSQRQSTGFSPESTDSFGGNLTEISINITAITASWQGYYGNVSGRITLRDVQNSILYNWEIITPLGEIYATRAYDINFATLNCTDEEEISLEEVFINRTSNDDDSVNKTFSKQSHPELMIGSINIPSDSCRSTNIYVNSSGQNTNYYEILLSDDASNIAYTAIIDANSTGFDAGKHDFQMLVGENGHNRDTNTTTYYFFIEIT